MVLIGLDQFSTVENGFAQLQVKNNSISVKTFHKYMDRFDSLFYKKITRELPEKLSVVFYGRSSEKTNYCGMFATFPVPNLQYYEPLQLFLIKIDENHAWLGRTTNFLSFILSVFKKDISNVMELLVYNVSFNKSVANPKDVVLWRVLSIDSIYQ